MAAHTAWLRLRLPDDLATSLRSDFQQVAFLTAEEVGEEPSREALAEVTVLFTGSPYRDELVQQMPKLRWVHATYAGATSFLTSTVKERPITVTVSKSVHGSAIAEFGIALMLAMAKRLPEARDAQREGRWATDLRPAPVAGQTLGIVGLGTIGTEIARIADAMRMRVIATKRTPGETPAHVDFLGTPDALPKLLTESDFLLLCAATTPSTTGLIGERELRAMKESAHLVNLVNTFSVDPDTLVRALKEGWIAGAALETVKEFPLPPDSPLWALPNVLITPRISSAGPPRWPELNALFADNLRRFLDGRELVDAADKERGY